MSDDRAELASETVGVKGMDMSTDTPLVIGHGDGPNVGGCVWDLTIYRATNGRVWSDFLPCFNAVLVAAGQAVNDRLQDLERIRPFSHRLERCKSAVDSKVEKRINHRLGLWCARRVEYLSTDPRVKACNDTTEQFLAGEASEEELRAAENAAEAVWATAETASAAAWAAAWAAEAAVRAARATAEAAWGAVRAAAETAESDDGLLEFLDALIDQWEKVAADEGALGFLADVEDFVQANGS